MEYGFIILNYNTYQLTIKLVIQLLLNFEPKRIILVDNASTNGSKKILQEFASEHGVHLLTTNINKGYAAGNNIGLKFARELGYNYVLILNNDIEIPDYKVVFGMLEMMKNNNDIAAISPIIVSPNGKVDPPLYFSKPSFWDLTLGIIMYYRKRYTKVVNNDIKIYAPRGSCMLLRNDVLKSIGDLDEQTFLYYEEPILAEKILAQKKEVWYFTQGFVIHNHASTIENHVDSKKRCNYLLNSYRYYLKQYRHFNKFKIAICLFIRRLSFYCH